MGSECTYSHPSSLVDKDFVARNKDALLIDFRQNIRSPLDSRSAVSLSDAVKRVEEKLASGVLEIGWSGPLRFIENVSGDQMRPFRSMESLARITASPLPPFASPSPLSSLEKTLRAMHSASLLDGDKKGFLYETAPASFVDRQYCDLAKCLGMDESAKKDEEILSIAIVLNCVLSHETILTVKDAKLRSALDALVLVERHARTGDYRSSTVLASLRRRSMDHVLAAGGICDRVAADVFSTWADRTGLKDVAELAKRKRIDALDIPDAPLPLPADLSAALRAPETEPIPPHIPYKQTGNRLTIFVCLGSGLSSSVGLHPIGLD